jgi:STE24 endopeptidase
VANEDKATRYHRLRRRTTLLNTAVTAALLTLLVISGASASLRNICAALAGSSVLPLTSLYVLTLVLLSEAVQLPFAFYQGVVLERRYGLSTQAAAHWWLDHLKAGVLTLGFGLGGGILVMAVLSWSPEWWWVLSAACFAVLLVALAQLAPVVLLPMFYDFKPLQRDALVNRLIALADRAGARVLGVFEWRLGDRTRKANAALTGLGRTRRIIVSDTLLADHSDDEIEVILAHELAHHVHHDIWTGLLLEAGMFTAAFYTADRVISKAVGTFGLQGKNDVAVLPVLLLAAGAVSIAVRPLFNAVSRAHERRADRYALELTNNAVAFVSAMKRLGSQNLAEEQPSRLVEMLFHSHPSTSARVAAAHAWSARQRSA